MPACEQSIHGSPDKHKGVVRETRASRSRETGCSVVKLGDTAGRTRESTLACSLSRARACRLVHSFCQKGRASPWRACAHLDRECRGVRPLGCMRSLACRRRRCGHDDDTKPMMCAWRWHRDRSMTSRLRPSGVQGRGGQRGSDLGLMARRTHVHRCVGVRGTARQNVEHGHGQAKQGLDPSGAFLLVRGGSVRRQDHDPAGGRVRV
jgi:hypothetical protein